MEIRMFASMTTAPELLSFGWLISPHFPRSRPSYHLERLFSRAADRHILMPLRASTKDGEHGFITRRLRFVIFGKRQIRALLLVQSEQVPQVVVDRQPTRGGLGADGLQNLRRDLFM